MIGTGDVAAILALDDFAVDVTFNEANVDTRGIFTDATQQVNVLTNEVEAVNPTVACETDAVSTVSRGHTVDINSVTYTIERIERLGTGLSLFHLKT